MTNISQEQQEEFSASGLIVLRRCLPKEKVEAAKQKVLEDLRRLNLYVGGKWQTKGLSGIDAFQISNRIGAKLKHYPEFEQLFPEGFERTLQALAGERISFLKTPAQLLVTPPQKEAWALPARGWHVDIATRDVLPGIQLFVLLDDLAPQGGATLAVKGSHRQRDLVPEGNNVLEMSGSAGDVYLMDMRVLHAPSINARSKARLMLTSRYMAAR